MPSAFLDRLKFFESIVATAAYAIVGGLLIVDVVGRELFGVSLLGAQQLAVYGAIIAGFMGLTLATSDNCHLRPTFLDFVFRFAEHNVQRFGDTVSAAFFFIGAYVSWTFVSASMDSLDKAPVLYFVIWPLQLVMPYAFISSGLKHLVFALHPHLKPMPDTGGH